MEAHGDYYSLHGIWGAGATLALGRYGKGSGFVLGDVQPPDTSIFIGYRTGHDEVRMLPFIKTNVKIGLDGSAYVSENKVFNIKTKNTFKVFSGDEIARTVTYSGESWSAGNVTLTITSFFGQVPDPAKNTPQVLRSGMCPVVLARVAFDNTDGVEPMTGYFGMNDINRPLSDSTDGSLLGMAKGCRQGFAVLPDSSIEEVMDWDAVEAAFNGNRTLRHLASDGGLRFRIDAGKKTEFSIALGVYEDGVVTTGYPARRYYTSLYRNLEDVLGWALENTGTLLDRAERVDALLSDTPLDDERKFLIAHAVHSYCASTELLLDDKGNPVFLVNEGEYRMMNTLDLTVDHAWHELCFTPWTLRNELDFFIKRSMYADSFGVAFSHDQGVANAFTPRGTSSYELPGLVDCFSFMSYEETLNWTLSACAYAANSGDHKWAAERSGTIVRCLDSLRSRDQNGDGIMDADSDRCKGGSEITTYDSLDISLGQARNNLYLAVKAWGTFVCLEAFFTRQNDRVNAARANETAHAIARTVVSKFDAEDRFIPAVFEGGNSSRIIPAIEGLAYPFLCGAEKELAASGPYAEFLSVLKIHLETVLVPGVCIDPVSDGWKLSSTSKNTWLSKIFLNQFVAAEIFGIDDERVRKDAAHAQWLLEGSADYAAADQVDSSTGHAYGSRLYPRLVTSVLWLLKYHRFECLKMPVCP
jgi:hypothetical protein